MGNFLRDSAFMELDTTNEIMSQNKNILREEHAVLSILTILGLISL